MCNLVSNYQDCGQHCGFVVGVCDEVIGGCRYDPPNPVWPAPFEFSIFDQSGEITGGDGYLANRYRFRILDGGQERVSWEADSVFAQSDPILPTGFTIRDTTRTLRWDQSLQFYPPVGDPVSGDELRVIAIDPQMVPDTFGEMSILLAGIGELVITSEQFDLVTTTTPDEGMHEGHSESFLALALSPNPAPKSASRQISLDLPTSDRVQIDLLDSSGRLVQTIVDRTLEAGRSTVSWLPGSADTGDPVSGIFFLRAQTSRGRSASRSFC